MVLETARVILRPFRETDLADLYEYSCQPGVGEMAGWKPHASLAESRLVLAEYMGNSGIFAVEDKEHYKVIGHLAVHKDSEEGLDDTKELGCALNRAYQRRGIMTEVISNVVAYLFEHGVKHVYACCFQENMASRRMIEKCGFTFDQQGTYFSKSLGQTFSSYEYVYHAQENAAPQK